MSILDLYVKNKDQILVENAKFRLQTGKSGSGKTLTAMSLLNCMPSNLTSSVKMSLDGVLKSEKFGIIMQIRARLLIK